MNQVEFNYDGSKIDIQCKENDLIKSIVEGFANKALINENKIKSLIILYGGNLLKEEEQKLTFNQIANEMDKERKKISLVVYDGATSINDKLVKSKNIICPKCKEHILIKISNYKVKLFNCKNEHITDNLSLKDFEKSQYLNCSEINCGNCKKKTMDNKLTNFFKCYECNINLCSFCQNDDDYEHNIINFEEIHYFCGKHNNDVFTKYCGKCKIDICSSCEDVHFLHKLTSFKDIMQNKRQLTNNLQKIKKDIDKCNDNFTKITKKIIEAKNNINDFLNEFDLYNEIGESYDGIIGIVNEVKNNFNFYYNLKKDIISNYDNSKKYYHLLINLKEINNNDDLIEDMNNIIQKNNIRHKFENILKIYKKIKNISEDEIINL